MSVPSHLAVLDRVSALSRVGGDAELLQEMAQLFLEEFPSQMDAIRQAVSTRNAREIERSAHSLKGSVGNFGAVAAQQAALDLEMLGRAGNLAPIEGALSTLERAIRELTPAMRELAGADALRR